MVLLTQTTPAVILASVTGLFSLTASSVVRDLQSHSTIMEIWFGDGKIITTAVQECNLDTYS